VVRKPADGRLRGNGSFKREEVHARLKEAMQERAVGSAARRFDQAQIAHKDRIEIGEPVDTILRIAREEGADIILVGHGPAGAVRRWLPKAIGLALATTAGQVAEQAEMPVVVVK
jgi:nucleotide-binding universal stress UspA family protein